jgi:hypothetical protein
MEKRRAFELLVGMSVGKQLFGRLRRKREDYIKLNFK